MNAGLGIGVALRTHGFLLAFAGAGVGGRALAPNRQTTSVAQTAVGLDVLQPLEVQAALAAQIALHEVIALLYDVNDFGQVVLVEVLGTGSGIDAGFRDNLRGDFRPDAVDVS